MTDNETDSNWSAEGGRASASRIRQGLDEMASSVREMEAFLQSAEKPVAAGAAPAQPKQGKEFSTIRRHACLLLEMGGSGRGLPDRKTTYRIL